MSDAEFLKFCRSPKMFGIGMSIQSHIRTRENFQKYFFLLNR